VVPLGKVAVDSGGAPDVFSGHLFEDLHNPSTTPNFMFVTPNLCNDGHDAVCAGPNTEGGNQGGLVGADLWLKHVYPGGGQVGAVLFNKRFIQPGTVNTTSTAERHRRRSVPTACSSWNTALQ
jgi:hypothetical protein